MSKKEERLTRMMDLLRVRGYISVRELSSLLEVSEMTVRRDLKLLEHRDIAKNVDGTTVYNPAHLGLKNDKAYNLLTEAGRQNPEKDRIGRCAAGLVEQGDVIIVDTGSTTARIAAHLPIDKNLTVLCYNINILMELRRNPGVRMMFAGGHYHPNTQMFESGEGVRFIRETRAQKVFVSAAGIHPQLGITCVEPYELPTKRAILQSSLRVILVADSTKFGAVRPAHFCDLENVHDVVTDARLSREWRELLGQLGIALHIAE